MQPSLPLPQHWGTAAASAPSSRVLPGPPWETWKVQQSKGEQQVSNQWRENPQNWVVAWMWGMKGKKARMTPRFWGSKN